MSHNNLTPAMKQYMEFKQKYPDCIILFRMGDFYETFYDDAKTTARELEITLTARGKGEKRAPLAGIPYHALDNYLIRLIKKGYKVAIVEQIEDPKKAKGLVKRDLVRIVTPGTIVEHEFLEGSKNNYLASINKNNDEYALCAVDISTGEFIGTIVNYDELLTELKKINPSEIIYPSNWEDFKIGNYFLTERPVHTFYHADLLEGTANALREYLKETQKRALTYLKNLRKYKITNYMEIDDITLRNLELLESVIYKDKNNSLYGVLDKTKTTMGSRLLRQWIIRPLIDRDKINWRLNLVETFYNKQPLLNELRQILGNIKDIERLISKVSYGNANPKDVLALGESIEQIPKLNSLLKDLYTNINELPDVSTLIKNSIKEEPNTIIREGNIIREGYNEELDELLRIKKESKKIILEIEEKERERTGIKNLRIGFNKVFGYYIEVTKKNLSLVPDDYIRKQTQANSERYITEELKEIEEKILGAEEKIRELEYNLYMGILEKISKQSQSILSSAHMIAELDVLSSFSYVAIENNYSKPLIKEDFDLVLKDSRHPVVEKSVDNFIENDCILTKEKRMMIITGPNMAGKSTYMRQIALIAIMAHIGSFVPASFAKIGIIKRVFSRVGAYDDLTHGQSTFMVEMTELANILNNATEDSLIIIDEIGRGTSTFDGVAIAWSTAEYLAKNIRAKTLFATHYHTLNHLEKEFREVNNYNISVMEDNGRIVFLRKIVHGGTDKSYGIHVASLAGLPKEVIKRAEEIQFKLEMEDNMKEKIVVDKEIKDGKKVMKKRFQKSLDSFY